MHVDLPSYKEDHHNGRVVSDYVHTDGRKTTVFVTREMTSAFRSLGEIRAYILALHNKQHQEMVRQNFTEGVFYPGTIIAHTGGTISNLQTYTRNSPAAEISTKKKQNNFHRLFSARRRAK